MWVALKNYNANLDSDVFIVSILYYNIHNLYIVYYNKANKVIHASIYFNITNSFWNRRVFLGITVPETQALTLVDSDWSGHLFVVARKPGNRRRSTNKDVMLFHHLQRWPNIKTTLAQCLVFVVARKPENRRRLTNVDLKLFIPPSTMLVQH